jgi:hypothetical protein
VFGPDILQEVEKQVHLVRENLRVTQLRQKSYTNHRRRELIFEVGDFVYLKVLPMRGFHHFKVRGKLAPRFIGPFKILEKRGEVAYQLKLPSQLSNVQDVFHISQLKKCLRVPEEQLPMEDLDAKEDLSYQEYPVKILETSYCRPKPTDGCRQATRAPGGPNPLSVGPAARTCPEIEIRWACHLTYT